MVVQDLTAAKHAQLAQALLAEADAHLAACEYDDISAKLWGAVKHAIAAAAAERGWQCEGDGYSELRPIVERLEEENTEDGILNTFLAANLWRNNRDHRFLDDYEYEFFAPSAHRFVSKALARMK